MIENEDMPTVHRPSEDQAPSVALDDAGQGGQTAAPAQAQVSDDPTTLEIPVTPAATGAAPAPSLSYLSVEDLLALQIAADPQISPDGSLIAFSVQRCHADTNSTSSAIWLVRSAGGKGETAWQVTGGAHHDTMPRWSPDGRTLAFLSDRDGTPQIYLLPMSGGEAHRLSQLAQGVTAYSWRPDGLALLAHSPWKPADDQNVPASDETTLVYTRLDAQWDGEGYRHGRHQQLWLVSRDGQAQRLTSEPVDLVQSCWSPDGTEIVFCANRRPDPDLSVSMALWVLTVATGQLRRLTPNEGLAQVPSWSPDGRFIAYLYTPDQTEAGNYAPWIVEARQGEETARPAVQGAGEITCQTWVIDELRSEWLAPPQWYPDSRALLVTSQQRGQVHLCRLDIEQDQRVQLTRGNGRYISPQISRDGQTITMIRADWFTPGDIWCMDGAGTKLRKLTRVNDAFLQSRQLIRPKRITWQSSDGLEIEGWLYLPHLPPGVKVPLILMPHGGPSLAWGDAYVHEFQVLAGRGYAVLAPNPRGSAGYGEEFSRRVLNDWGGADFGDLMIGIDHVIASEPIDGARLGIAGISYGGYMTSWAITQTGRFKAAVSRNGISSLPGAALLSDQTIWFNLCLPDETLQRSRSPLAYVDRITAPLLLLHAENDLRCPFSESLQLFSALRKRKHPVELVRYRHVSHLMDWPEIGAPMQRVDRLRRTLEWFERFL